MATSDFDFAVIGAGIAGASVAAHLAEHGRVAVFEQESQPGRHATGRSAALFSEVYGAEPVRALSRGSRAALNSPAADFSEVPFVKPRGVLHVASEGQLDELRAFADLPDVAPAVSWLSSAEAIALCPILRPDRVAAAVLEPEAADVDVDALHQAYLRRLRARRGQVLTDRRVEALRFDDGAWTFVAGGETFRAPVVINAAGAWADEVARMAGVEPLGIQPLRRTALLVDPPAGAHIAAWPMVIGIDESFYFKPDAGQLLLSPADETAMAACDAQPDEWDIAVAVERVEAVTTLEVRRVKHRWAGLRSFAPDRVPVVGYDPQAPGFFWLAGQGGYGIQTCPALSRTAAALALGEPIPADLADFGVRAGDLAPTRLRSGTATG
jgi:D-arginine dehydrogenase